jgi:endonuclease-3
MSRAKPRLDLARVLDALEALYGKPARSIPRTPFEWIVWENVAYLVDDERSERAYRMLATKVGIDPARIACAPHEKIYAATQLGGMHREQRVDRLKEIAELALAEGGGGLEPVLELPAAAAKKILKKFPSIGDPGAEKILVFCGAARELALESNGLRVLVRLGFGDEKPSYSATYRSVREATAGEIERDPAWLARAHVLLRAHGQALCTRTSPDCDACPLAKGCRCAASAS